MSKRQQAKEASTIHVKNLTTAESNIAEKLHITWTQLTHSLPAI